MLDGVRKPLNQVLVICNLVCDFVYVMSKDVLCFYCALLQFGVVLLIS